jgi:pentatricopeptide repeat protein
MKEKTLKLIDSKLNLLEGFVKEGNKDKCIEVYNSIPSTGWRYFIDEIINRGLGKVEGPYLEFNFE